MKKMIECGFKRSMLMAAVLAAFLFAAGCGGGVDDPSKKKINEGKDKTGTEQTDGSGSSSSDTTSGGGNGDNTGGGNGDNTGGGNGDNTGGGNGDNTGGGNGGGTVSTEVKVKVQTISSATGTHDQVSPTYDSATLVTVTVDVVDTASNFMDKVKEALAAKVVTAAGAGTYAFYTAADGATEISDKNSLGESKTIYVGKERAPAVTQVFVTLVSINDIEVDFSGDKYVKVDAAMTDILKKHTADSDSDGTKLFDVVKVAVDNKEGDYIISGAEAGTTPKALTKANLKELVDAAADTEKKVYIGRKNFAKLIVKLITTSQTFTSGDLSSGGSLGSAHAGGAANLKVKKPDNGSTPLGASNTMTFESTQTQSTTGHGFTVAIMQEAATKIKDKFTTAAIGTADGKYGFFMKDAPTADSADYIKDLAALSTAHTDFGNNTKVQDGTLTIYVGLFHD